MSKPYDAKGHQCLALVAPPIRPPGLPATTLFAAKKALAGYPGKVTTLDAARSYWDDVMTASRSGGLSDDTRLAGIDVCLARLCDGNASDLEVLIDDLQKVDRLLEYLSSRYLPARLERRGFVHPDLNSVQALAAFAVNRHANPFADFSRRWARHHLDAEPIGKVIFLAETPGQVVAAATMAAELHRRHVHIKAHICGPNRQILEFRYAARRPPAFQAREPSPLHDDVLAAMTAAGNGLTPGPVLVVDNAGVDQAAQTAAGSNVQLMVWRIDDRPLPDLAPILYDLAKKGVWHHLELGASPDHPIGGKLARFAAVNPNIVHSWAWRQAPVSTFSDGRLIFPNGAEAYGHTARLPGRPVWQILQEPVRLTAALSLLGRDGLMRRWMVADGRPSVEIGRQLVWHYQSPDQLAGGLLDEICEMVAAGGSVNTRWVRHNLERAFLIGYVTENGIVIGNSSLKKPRKEYIQAVSRQSGIDLTRYLERGYTSVRPEYRGLGIGTRLLEGLTTRAGDRKIFSVIGEDNLATQKMAIRNRTRKVAWFFSHKAGKPVGVWIPEWMIDDTFATEKDKTL